MNSLQQQDQSKSRLSRLSSWFLSRRRSVCLSLTCLAVCLICSTQLSGSRTDLRVQSLFWLPWKLQQRHQRSRSPSFACANSSDLMRVFGIESSHQTGVFGIESSHQTGVFVRLDSPVDMRQRLTDKCVEEISQRMDNQTEDKHECFKESGNAGIRDEVYSTLHSLQQNFTSRSLEFFLCGGSLIGAQRHFGFIPWDDDLDVMIRADEKERVRQLLTELSLGDDYRFVDTEKQNGHWRLDMLCQRRNNSKEKECKISLDLFFLYVGSRISKRAEPPHRFPTEILLPVTTRPFGRFLMRVPRDPDEFLKKVYGGGSIFHSCSFHVHSNSKCEGKRVECSRLAGRFPFVTRLTTRLNGRLVQADILTKGWMLMAAYVHE